MTNPVIPDKSQPWPEAHYYEGNPEGFDVYEWSPMPPGTKDAPVTQVHLHAIAAFGRIAFRFKSNRTLDRLIAALLDHRLGVFKVEPFEPELERVISLKVLRRLVEVKRQSQSTVAETSATHPTKEPSK